MNTILWESVWPDVWSKNKCRSLWPIFYGSVILPYILTVWCLNIILQDYESVWPDIWPQNKCGSLWHIFHVQWFCLISWRLFDVWTSYFGIVSPYDPTFDLKINVGHCDLYSMVHWFCLMSWRILYIWTPSVWHNVWPKNKWRSLWPIFYGSVILSYILKTFQ